MTRYIMAVTSLAAALFTHGLAHAQQMRPILDHAAAEAIGDHCLASAREAGVRIAIAIYDHGGVMVMFDRMDGASTGAVDAAHWKGRSAAIWQFSTVDTASWDPTVPNLARVEGGVTIFNENGFALGGVGVSGASSTFDAACAAEAIRAAGLRDHGPL